MGENLTEDRFIALLRKVPEGERRVVFDFLKVAAGETTERAPVEPRPDVAASDTPPSPRLKWKTDRDAGEDVAHFAARAYATEIADGTLDKALIRRKLDKPLYQRPVSETPRGMRWLRLRQRRCERSRSELPSGYGKFWRAVSRFRGQRTWAYTTRADTGSYTPSRN